MTMKTFDQPWTIKPFVGVGPLTLGISRDEVRALLGNRFCSFRKGPYATNETDTFDDIGIHAHYDANDRLECVEAVGDAAVEFNGIPLLEKSIFDVLQQPTLRKINYVFENGLYIFEPVGFSLYVEGDTIKSVGVFRRGYYD